MYPWPLVITSPLFITSQNQWMLFALAIGRSATIELRKPISTWHESIRTWIKLILRTFHRLTEALAVLDLAFNPAHDLQMEADEGGKDPVKRNSCFGSSDSALKKQEMCWSFTVTRIRTLSNSSGFSSSHFKQVSRETYSAQVNFIRKNGKSSSIRKHYPWMNTKTN